MEERNSLTNVWNATISTSIIFQCTRTLPHTPSWGDWIFMWTSTHKVDVDGFHGRAPVGRRYLDGEINRKWQNAGLLSQAIHRTSLILTSFLEWIAAVVIDSDIKSCFLLYFVNGKELWIWTYLFWIASSYACYWLIIQMARL